MRSAPAISLIESHGFSECLDRLSARARQDRPLATYRLQFHAGFRFVDALRILPYLEQLGVSHCYSSPILKARPGSMHGYDITDHNQLNPEIGKQEEFQAFASELKQRGMGLILDVVPNHVGISENNPWWRDVLENGRASAYADYFDIDWRPLKAELLNKLLLPILGEQYGEELEQGRLSLVFDEEAAEFLVGYYDRRLPLDPRSLPRIFSPIRLPALRERADDVPLIAEHFITKYTREMGKPLAGMVPEVFDVLKAYPWPGNVRELENVIERAVALETSDRVQVTTLPDHLRAGRPATPMAASASSDVLPDSGFNLEQHLQEIERNHLERALKQAGGVQIRAAELLGLTFRQFRYLVKKYGLKA